MPGSGASQAEIALFGRGRSVVQCGVADDVEPFPLGGGDSPWAHDLPIADPAPLPAAWATATVDPDESSPVDPLARDALVAPRAEPTDSGTPPTPIEAPTPGHHPRRTATVVGMVGLLAAAVLGAQVAGGGDDPTSDDESAATVTTAGSATSDAPQTASTAAPSIKVQTRNRLNRLRPTTSVAERLPPPPPEWVSTTLALNPRVAAIAAPTQLVALGRDGTLYVIDTPTGTMHSIDTGMTASNVMLSLGARDVLLSSYDSNDMMLARVDEPIASVDLEDGAARVIKGGGNDDFILVPNTWRPDFPGVLRLGSDGQLASVTTGPLVQFDPWQAQFLETTGQMIVNDTGGVYLVDDVGAATRISTGDLVFLGPNHFVTRECDGTLACVYVRVDQTTGQRDNVDLGALDQYRQWGDPSSWSLSPDGTGVSYFDWQNGGPLPARRLVDLTTGTNVKVESADQYTVESAWAADSSGLFVIADRTIVFYDRRTGEQVPVALGAGLDDIVAVATRPITE